MEGGNPLHGRGAREEARGSGSGLEMEEEKRMRGGRQGTEGREGARVVLSTPAIAARSIKASVPRLSGVRLLLAVYAVGITPGSCSAFVVLGPRWPPSWPSLDHSR